MPESGRTSSKVETLSEERSERLRTEAPQNAEIRHARPGFRLAPEGSKKKKLSITSHHN
jgi:hypothetical protein